MKIFTTALMICAFYLAFPASLTFSQIAKKSKNKPASTQIKDKRTNSKTTETGEYFPDDEIKSPFRYVIVYDDVQFGVREEAQEEVPVRRFVKVLMDERAFNEANLTYLFKYLSKFYDNPVYLGIEVHTSLMTLETLEESLALSTHSNRDDFRQFYKTASYQRFNDGDDGFQYSKGKSGEFTEKYVDFTKPKKKQNDLSTEKLTPKQH